MKKILISTIVLLSVCYYNLSASAYVPDSVRVFCPAKMYDLVNGWSERYNAVGSGGKVSVSVNACSVFPDNSISIIEGPEISQGDNRWAMAVGRDVVVPVINADNPLIARIKSKGLSPENLSHFIKYPSSASWGTLLGTDNNEKAGLYIVDDESLINALATFLGVDIKARGGVMVQDAQELFSALKRDRFAIGFCKLVSLTNNQDPEFAGKILIAPIDRNGDGRIDHNEDIYQDLVAFTRGVWIGKYPRALTGNIFAVVSGKAGEAQVAFLKWVLNDGQEMLDRAGLMPLLAGERQSCNDRLAELTMPVSSTGSRPVIATMVYVIVLLLLAILLVNLILRFSGKKVTTAKVHAVIQNVLDENSLILPGGLMFDRTHMWSFMEQNGTIKVGIDDFLSHVTGEITRIVMKQKGDYIRKGDEIVSLIRNGKHLTVYSPVSGIIREKNKKLEEDIYLLNKSPYDEGWIYRIEPVNWAAENKLLIMADKYRQIIHSEILRLKEFLEGFRNIDHPQYAKVVMQDGGALIDNPLAEMGPEVWEDFQIKFIDSAKTH